MKKLYYILIPILFLSLAAFAWVPNPVNIPIDFYSLDGYPEVGKISVPIPNPVVDYAEIWYNIPEGKTAEIAIYNFTGVKVKSVPIAGGIGKIDLAAYDLQNGVYFVCLIYGGKNMDSKKLIKK